MNMTVARRSKDFMEMTGTLSPSTTAGVKFDHGKLRYDLVSVPALEEIIKVLGFGATKYAPRNWEKGIEYCRVYAALQRHINAWFQGEALDPETGISHLAHAGCCLMFLLHFELHTDQYKDKDDRP